MEQYLERTLVIIKPDGVKRGIVGKIIDRFETSGLTIVAMKLCHPSIDFVRKHYPMTEAQLSQMGNKTLSTYKELGIDPIKELGTDDPNKIGLMVHEWNAEFLSSGPVLAIILKGIHAVKKVRSLCGKTMPMDASAGTIRGDFSSSSPAIANIQKSAVYNLVHASDNENDPEEPEKEIAHWFKPDEIFNYKICDYNVMFKIN